MRPIDADAMDVEQINSYYAGSCRTEDVQEWLDDQPTLDVEPVRHGSWKNCGQISRTQWLWRCSLCGCPQDYAHNYCPNCGARMDAKEE